MLLSCEVEMCFQRIRMRYAIAVLFVSLVVLIAEVLISQKICSHNELKPVFTTEALKEIIPPSNAETLNYLKVPSGTPSQEPNEEVISMFKFPVVASIATDAVNITISSEKLIAELVSSNKRLGYEEPVNWPQNSSDIYFSMKSIAAYHAPRLSLLMVTWLQTVDPLQVHIVTDSDADPWIRALQNRGTRVTVTTSCPSGHKHVASQCCKAGLQYKGYYMATKMEQKKYRWFCHFDDDVYVNIGQLVKMLEKYNPTTEKIYLGHFPVHLWKKWGRAKENRISYGNLTAFPERKKDSYVYATGASYCVSSSLMESMEKYLSGHNFHATCDKLQAADDLVIGIIIVAVLGYNLVEVPKMTSEVEDLTKLNRDLADLITIGYHLKAAKVPRTYGYYLKKNNRVTVPGSSFTEQEDPSSFLSYHCLLYPSTSWCVAKRDHLHLE